MPLPLPSCFLSTFLFFLYSFSPPLVPSLSLSFSLPPFSSPFILSPLSFYSFFLSLFVPLPFSLSPSSHLSSIEFCNVNQSFSQHHRETQFKQWYLLGPKETPVLQILAFKQKPAFLRNMCSHFPSTIGAISLSTGRTNRWLSVVLTSIPKHMLPSKLPQYPKYLLHISKSMVVA